MRTITAILGILALSACAGNTPAAAMYSCDDPAESNGHICTDYVTGWTADSARAACNAGTFYSDRACAQPQLAHCTLSDPSTGQTITWRLYSFAGMGSIDYWRMNCVGGTYVVP